MTEATGRPAECGEPELAQTSRTEMIMGLPVSIHLRESAAAQGFGAPATLDATVASAFELMRRHERIFSPYLPESMLMALRDGRCTAASAGPEFAEVLRIAGRARRRTLGAFDVHFDGVLDPSGIVKGWSAERAGLLLATLGIDFYLNAGGDITCAASATPWRLGVEHPFHPQGLITVVALRGQAMATSGSAHRGAHILDPSSGRPAGGIRQVTVIGPTLTWADIWATAIVARGPASLEDPRDALVQRCRSDGCEVLAITDRDEVFATPGFAAYQVSDLPRPAAREIAGLR